MRRNIPAMIIGSIGSISGLILSVYVTATGALFSELAGNTIAWLGWTMVAGAIMVLIASMFCINKARLSSLFMLIGTLAMAAFGIYVICKTKTFDTATVSAIICILLPAIITLVATIIAFFTAKTKNYKFRG